MTFKSTQTMIATGLSIFAMLGGAFVHAADRAGDIVGDCEGYLLLDLTAADAPGATDADELTRQLFDRAERLKAWAEQNPARHEIRRDANNLIAMPPTDHALTPQLDVWTFANRSDRRWPIFFSYRPTDDEFTVLAFVSPRTAEVYTEILRDTMVPKIIAAFGLRQSFEVRLEKLEGKRPRPRDAAPDDTGALTMIFRLPGRVPLLSKISAMAELIIDLRQDPARPPQ